MPIIESRINPRSAEYGNNAAAMQTQLDDLTQQLAQTALGGSEAARAKHRARGKLLPRERVERLLDSGRPFLELSPMAAHGMYEGEAPGAGLITGIGRIANIECVIVCNDATVKGGTYYPITVKKHLRAQEIALQNNLLLLTCGAHGNVIRFLYPLTIEDELFEQGLAVLEKAVAQARQA